MSSRRRLTAALARRIRGPYQSLGRVDARLDDLQSRLGRVERLLADDGRAAAETHDLAAATHELLGGEIRAVLRALVAEESTNRRRLSRMRDDPAYAAGWEEPRPLVTVTLVTHDRPQLLATRSLPSILAQTYGDLEVIVVGDHAGEDTFEAVRGIADRRVTYRNLTQRLQFTDDPHRRWLVAATMGRNEAMRLARGRWVICFDDDDAMRPDCVEKLVVHAREHRIEAVYGQAAFHRGGEPEFLIGSFPPAPGKFTWASGMYHSGLRFFEREIFAADLGEAGDWFLASRMLRAGVRFGMVDAVLADVYPSVMNRVGP